MSPESPGKREASTGRYLGSAALLVGLLICLAFPIAFPALETDDTPSYLNPAREWASGRGLAEGNGAPLEQRLPLYPLLLGITLRIVGDSPLAIGILNVFLHVLSVLLVRGALPKRPLCDLLCAAALVYPPLLTTTGLILQESLIAFTLSALFVATARALRDGAAPGWGFVAGLALGLSALAKTTVLLAGASLVLLVWRRASSRVQVLAFVGGVALVLLPWMARNRLELGRYELANSNAGVAFFAGTFANVVSPSWDAFPEYLKARAQWEAEGHRYEPVFDRYLVRWALDRIAADPARWFGLVLERAFRFMLPARHWFVVTGRSQNASAGPIYLAATAIQLILFGACALLLLNGIRSPGSAVALVAPLIVFSHLLVYAASHSSPRYGASVGPLLFASLALLLVQEGARSPGT